MLGGSEFCSGSSAAEGMVRTARHALFSGKFETGEPLTCMDGLQDSEKFRSTMSSLNYGHVMAAAARDYQQVRHLVV